VQPLLADLTSPREIFKPKILVVDPPRRSKRMKPLNFMRTRTFAMVGAIVIASCLTAGAQTTTTPAIKKVPIPTHPAKPAPPAAPAKPVAQKTQTPPPAVIPASSQTVISPASQQAVVNSSVPGSGMTAPGNLVNGMSTTGSNALSGLSSAGSNAVSGYTSAGSNAASNALTGMTGGAGAAPSAGQSFAGSSGNRAAAPVGSLGVGSFVGSGWTLVVYGCFRTGTRLFCDCDTSYQSNLQANTTIWYTVKLVDDGGKMTDRHNAFFVGDDGSPFQSAYLTSSKTIRFMMEYDNIDQRYTSVSLVQGQQQIQGIPITPIDPNLPAGTMPARATQASGNGMSR
jgi:hypothetical protein